MTLERGSYYFRGPDRKRVNLGHDYADALARYADFFRDVPLSTFGAVLDRYVQHVVPKKAKRTQVDNARYMAVIRAVFGHMAPAAITPVYIYQFRDGLATKSGNVQANRHLELIKHVFVKAQEWGSVQTNPARDVRKLAMKPRERYVTDDEYLAVYAEAPETAQVAMDLALLTGLRRGDLLALTRAQIHDDGIHVRTGKTGKRLIIEWNADLREVVARAKRIKPQMRQHLIATRSGKQFTGDGFGSIWLRAVRRAIQKGTLGQPFTFNDLRAKSASDAADAREASARLGHSSEAITNRVYRRKPARVRALTRTKDQEAF
jgi:integrase